MKKILFIIVLLSALNSFSQIDLNIYQDVRLAISEDDHLNKPFTLDIVVMPRLYNGGTRSYNWTHEIFVYPYFEYADLNNGTFSRYAMGIGITFKDVFTLNRLNTVISVDEGIIIRDFGTSFSFNTVFEINYNLTKRIKIALLNTFTQRGDIKKGEWVRSFYIGFSYLVQK